jgi:hypothetical protein
VTPRRLSVSRPRRASVPAEVLERAGLGRAEKVLAFAQAHDGAWLLGTRRSLVLLTAEQRVTMPWEEVEDAAWNLEEKRLRVTGVGEYGRPRPSYTVDMDDPALLLQLVRERVTASIVLQRRVPVRGRLGVTVIGRRSPTGGLVRWMHAYDEGLDPQDPEVVAVADLALLQAQSEVGESPGNSI